MVCEPAAVEFDVLLDSDHFSCICWAWLLGQKIREFVELLYSSVESVHIRLVVLGVMQFVDLARNIGFQSSKNPTLGLAK